MPVVRQGCSNHTGNTLARLKYCTRRACIGERDSEVLAELQRPVPAVQWLKLDTNGPSVSLNIMSARREHEWIGSRIQVMLPPTVGAAALAPGFAIPYILICPQLYEQLGASQVINKSSVTFSRTAHEFVGIGSPASVPKPAHLTGRWRWFDILFCLSFTPTQRSNRTLILLDYKRCTTDILCDCAVALYIKPTNGASPRGYSTARVTL